METHFKCLEKFSYSFKKTKKYKHFGTQMSSRAVSLSTKKKNIYVGYRYYCMLCKKQLTKNNSIIKLDDKRKNTLYQQDNYCKDDLFTTENLFLFKNI